MREAVVPAVFAPTSRSQGDFRREAWSAQIYVGAAVLAGAGLLAQGLAAFPAGQLPLFFVLLTLSTVASAVKISLPVTRSGSTLSLSYVVNFTAMLLLGPWATVPIAVCSGWSQCTFRVRERNPWHQTLFSMATLAITVAAAGVAYRYVLPDAPAAWWTGLGAVAVAATVYFLLNTALVASALALSTGESPLAVWQKNFLWSAPSYFAGAAVAAMVLEVTHDGQYWWALIFSLPAYLTYRSYQAYSERIGEEQRQVRALSGVQLATIEALALAIEAKDSTSRDHLQRIQVYAEGLARAVGLTEPEILGVKTAGLLHDIGNLAVPEHILSKMTRLSYDEFERVKIHPRVGAEILKSVPFPYPVTPLILSHHERWDGRGYPSGLKGDDIPVGARILAVVDCFTSMLSERPYRPARTYAEAIVTLRENGGAGLDPALVEKFIEILPGLEYALYGGRAYSEASTAVEAGDGADAAVTAFTDIAGAHREEQMLHQVAQALSASLRISDTLALISSRLVTTVPFSSCALYLFDEASELYLCRHATGPQQDGIKALSAGSIQTLAQLLPALPVSSHNGGPAAARLHSVLVAPLPIDGRQIGALAAYHTEREVYTADHRRLFERVAMQAAPVIANAVVFEQTQEQSLTDVLTGLPNRRFLDRQLDQELARSQRHLGHVSLLVLDMDRFKPINDEFGHQAGDRALKEVAMVLRAGLRVYDVCARLAGDEFVVVLGDCDQAQAERRRLELQNGVNSVGFEPVPGHTVPLAVSVGASTFPDDGQTAEDLMAAADRRMYRDKAQRKPLESAWPVRPAGGNWP